jgi:uncharacterized circularly permuted ATP-grasp superfamily protein
MAALDSKHASGRLLAALDEMDLRALSRSLSRDLRERSVTFGGADGGTVEEFVVDPVPRVIARDEWDVLAAGLGQRAEALERFVADVYGERRIVAAGRVPWSAIESAEFYEPRMAQLPPASGRWITIAGLDLVRDGDGPFLVLEDNVRTPSGIAYAVAAREALSGHLSVPDGMRVRSLEPGYEALGEALRAAAPPEAGEHPSIVVLTDGPSNSAYYEHGAIARRLGLPLVRPEDLRVRFQRLFAHTDDGIVPVDVVYRRTDEDRLFDGAGAPTTLAEMLLGPLEAQTLGCVNAFGTGVADDKLVHIYVEEMVRFYLDEEPLLASVPTHDLSQPGVLEMTLERIDELAVKPRRTRRHWRRRRSARRPASAGGCLARAGRSARALHRAGDGQPLAPAHRLRRRARAPPCRPSPVHLRRRRAGRGLSRRAHPRRARARLACRQLLPARWRQGHLGARMTTGPGSQGPTQQKSLPALIGVTTSELRLAKQVRRTRHSEPAQVEMALGLPYLRAVERAGGLPVVLPPLELDRISPLLDRLSGVLLSGGPDLDPAAYGRAAHPELGDTEPQLDIFEVQLAREADARGLPMLGICRGAQALNVARGGTLHQHLPDITTARSSTASASRGRRQRTRCASPPAAVSQPWLVVAVWLSTRSTIRASTGSVAGCEPSRGPTMASLRASRDGGNRSSSEFSGTRRRSLTTPLI